MPTRLLPKMHFYGSMTGEPTSECVEMGKRGMKEQNSGWLMDANNAITGTITGGRVTAKD